MRCPFCGAAESRVLESREARNAEAIRRRRECESCSRRFTTFEEVEKLRLFVIKRDGTREEFQRAKLRSGILLACRKRPVPIQLVDEVTLAIERELYDLGSPEVYGHEVGRRVMNRLLEIDAVAYVRFASVYEQFENPEEFGQLVKNLKKTRQM